MEKRRHRVRHAAREYLTHWSVAGAIVAATGAAPDHWFAELAHHLPHEIWPHWLDQVDYRLVAVIVGLSVIVGDTLWRHHGRRPPNSAGASERSAPSGVPAVTAASPLDAVAPSRTQSASEGLQLPDKPSIAVLAFTNMGDPEQEYFPMASRRISQRRCRESVGYS